MEMSIEIDQEFSVIGTDDRLSTRFAEASSTSPVVVEQQLYEDLGSDEEWGERVGDLRGVCFPVGQGQALCNVVLRFDGKLGKGSVSAAGILDVAGEADLSGAMAISGGTGPFRQRRGELQVTSWNPKRWRLAV